DSPKLALIDVQYSEVRPEKGLFYRLEAAGRIRRLTTDDQVAAAVANAPTDTRAFLRGGAIERFTASVAAASWDSLVLERADGSLVRIALRDPLSFTRDHVGEALADAESADDLVARLS